MTDVNNSRDPDDYITWARIKTKQELYDNRSLSVPAEIAEFLPENWVKEMEYLYGQYIKVWKGDSGESNNTSYLSDYDSWLLYHVPFYRPDGGDVDWEFRESDLEILTEKEMLKDHPEALI